MNEENQRKSEQEKETSLKIVLIAIIVLFMVFYVLGKMLYLRDHWASKTIDTMGIATYLLYVVISSPASTNSGVFTPMMSFCHMVQILQLYRLTHRQVRLMMRTIYYQFGYLFSIILFTIAIFLILARCMFLLERQANPNINNIYDASWLVFVTIICIG